MKQKKYILLLIAALCCLSVAAQNISGRWVGGHAYATKITLDIIQIKDSVTGNAFIVFENDIGKANIAISGNIIDGILEYETSKILEQNIDSNYVLCFVSGKDFLKIKKHKHILEGACISIDKKEECFNLSCIEKYVKKVDFAFRKNDFNGRKVLVVDTLFATQDTLELFIRDNLKEDGDIVSVYLNENRILSNYLLKHKPEKIKINCKQGLNEILLYAHNLGSEPPNTATIAVYQNGKLLKELDIKSDADKSESFIIMRP